MIVQQNKNNMILYILTKLYNLNEIFFDTFNLFINKFKE